VDFDRHYGRCVVLLGIPFQYTKSHVLLSRLEFLRSTLNINEGDFLAFDAMRQVL
jgi:DNA excision repair protein ERCC-2